MHGNTDVKSLFVLRSIYS